MFIRRLGQNSDRTLCASGYNCPGILELNTGDFAVVGVDITNEAANKLPPGGGCGPDERIVRIPRATLVSARADIPAVL
jgi:hypothetical protein